MQRQRGGYWDGTEVIEKPKKPQPRIDPEIEYGQHPNDFDRWYAEKQREKSRGPGAGSIEKQSAVA